MISDSTFLSDDSMSPWSLWSGLPERRINVEAQSVSHSCRERNASGYGPQVALSLKNEDADITDGHCKFAHLEKGRSSTITLEYQFRPGSYLEFGSSYDFDGIKKSGFYCSFLCLMIFQQQSACCFDSVFVNVMPETAYF